MLVHAVLALMFEIKLCLFKNKPADFVYFKSDWGHHKDCISDCFVAVIKIHDKISLKEEGLIWAHN